MQTIDKAISILEKTNDGNQLTPSDLALVEAAANGRLTEAGDVAFCALYQSVTDGSYLQTPHWFHGIEHLTKDHEGYVYWKGQHVEHYSFDDKEREAEAARELAQRCQALEEREFPVNGRTVLSEDCYQAPAGTPWKWALCRYYSFFEKNGQGMGLFYLLNKKADGTEVVGVYKDAGGIHQINYPGAYEGYHAARKAGWEPSDIPRTFEDSEKLLQATGLSGSELDLIISGM